MSDDLHHRGKQDRVHMNIHDEDEVPEQLERSAESAGVSASDVRTHLRKALA